MNSSDLGMPWVLMPESRKPAKGKWSGPRAGALLICEHGQEGRGSAGQRLTAATSKRAGLAARGCQTAQLAVQRGALSKHGAGTCNFQLSTMAKQMVTCTLPVSMASEIWMALFTSRVNTQPCSASQAGVPQLSQLSENRR